MVDVGRGRRGVGACREVFQKTKHLGEKQTPKAHFGADWGGDSKVSSEARGEGRMRVPRADEKRGNNACERRQKCPISCKRTPEKHQRGVKKGSIGWKDYQTGSCTTRADLTP